MFILPFFYFDGMTSIRAFFEGLIGFLDKQSGWGMGVNFGFTNFTKIIDALFDMNVSSISSWLKYVTVLFLLILFALAKQEWKKLFALAMICIWYPNPSYTYVLIFLIPSLISFINCDISGNCFFDVGYRILYLLVFIPMALPSLSQYDSVDAAYPLTYSTAIINFVLFVFVIILMVDCITNLKKKDNKFSKEMNSEI